MTRTNPYADLEAELAADISEMIRSALREMLAGGCPAWVVISAAHAAAVAEAVDAFGGDHAAELCAETAERVRGLPAGGARLAAMQPLGRA